LWCFKRAAREERTAHSTQSLQFQAFALLKLRLVPHHGNIFSSRKQFLNTLISLLPGELLNDGVSGATWENEAG